MENESESTTITFEECKSSHGELSRRCHCDRLLIDVIVRDGHLKNINFCV